MQTISSGGTLEVGSGVILSGTAPIVSGGITIDILSGGSASGINVSTGVVEIVSFGGSGALLSGGGSQVVLGTAIGVNLDNGDVQTVSSAAQRAPP